MSATVGAPFRPEDKVFLEFFPCIFLDVCGAVGKSAASGIKLPPDRVGAMFTAGIQYGDRGTLRRQCTAVDRNDVFSLPSNCNKHSWT